MFLLLKRHHIITHTAETEGTKKEREKKTGGNAVMQSVTITCILLFFQYDMFLSSDDLFLNLGSRYKS